METASLSGILLVDKAEGVTSRQIDNAIQKAFKTRKVGHLGTLDPFATGLLLVAVNKATKYLPFLDDSKKRYVASLRLGVATSTGDKDGEVTEEAAVPPLSQGDIESALSSFLGESLQVPPMTSAIKIGGKALYELAHEGKEIPREPRKIVVYDIALISYHPPVVVFEALVSKGTYMRTLGEDLARKLGTVGHLESLRRVEVGNIGLDAAKPVEEITQEDLHNPADFLPSNARVILSKEEEKLVKNGRPIALSSNKETLFALSHSGEGIAVLQKGDRGLYRVLRGLF